MSYGAAMALQSAVYQTLRSETAITDLVGDAIFDAMPPEAPTGPYVALGPEEATDAGDMTGRGSRHDFVVSVLAGTDQSAGFRAVKETAVAVADTLERAALTLSRGHLVGMWLLRAKARRAENGEARRVDLTFRARVDLG